MSARFIALYAGPTTQTARMVAAIKDPDLVLAVAEAALGKSQIPEDPVLACLEAGSKGALQQILLEGKSQRGRHR